MDTDDLRPAILAEPPRLAWTGRMIRPLADRGVGTPASFVTRSFTLDSVTGEEILHVSALGLYRAFLNGHRVGNDLLTPGWTAYHRRLSYQSYGVGELLVPGENHIDIWLADGWLRSQMMWGQSPIFNAWGEHVAAIAELRGPGSAKPLLVTDADWKSGELPVRRSGIYFGEIFDARIVPTVTHGTAFLDFDPSILVPHEVPPVRELAPLPVVSRWNDAEGRTICDFGQNAAGNVAITVRGAAGARVIVEHGEVLDGNGQFYNGNYRTAAARLEYILKGGGGEHYRPCFTFQGYRYVRVTIEGEARLRDIVSVPISSLAEVKAAFTCANPLVNRLVLNTLWSQRSNFIEVPTDCPQRDERLGWTGDAQVFAGTACYFADVHDFFRKWLRDVMADQLENGAIPHASPDPTRIEPGPFTDFAGSTGWGDAIHVVPWQLYLHYGDRAFLAEALPAMVRWVDFVWSISDGPVVSPSRKRGKGFSFGDWLQPSGTSTKPLPTIGDEAAATIYLFIAATQVARIAGIVGDTAIAERMAGMAEQVRAAFAREFVTPSGRLAYDDQTSYALAFLHDLIPERQREAAKGYFRKAVERADGRIGTGFIGTPALLPALTGIGAWDLAARVFLQEEPPGWLYQVRMGATTIWERWDAVLPDGTMPNPRMNSFNHYAYGAVCQWLFEVVAGFRPDPQDPGFATIIFEPVIIPALSPVKAHHDSPHGTMAVEWSIEGDQLRYVFDVPSRSQGRLLLSPAYGDVVLDGVASSGRRFDGLAPGRHIVTFTYRAAEGPRP